MQPDVRTTKRWSTHWFSVTVTQNEDRERVAVFAPWTQYSSELTASELRKMAEMVDAAANELEGNNEPLTRLLAEEAEIELRAREVTTLVAADHEMAKAALSDDRAKVNVWGVVDTAEQDLRLECLKLAANLAGSDRAKFKAREFYDFVRGAE